MTLQRYKQFLNQQIKIEKKWKKTHNPKNYGVQCMMK